MSISSFTMVTMLDSRPAPITIAMPYTKDIPNRVITFKDIYGSAQNSTIILVTTNGDIFENSTFSTIMSNAFETMTFHAGLANRWHRIQGTTSYGGITVSSTFTNSLSTTNAYISVLSSGTIYSKLYGDGSQLTNLPTTFSGATSFSNINIQSVVNVCNVSTGFITASNISINSLSTNFGYAINLSTNLLGAVTANITTLNVTTPTFISLSTNSTTNLNGLTTSGSVVISNTLTANYLVVSNTLSVVGNNTTTFASGVNLTTVSTSYISASNISTNSLSTTSAYFSILTIGSEIGGSIRASNISSAFISTQFITASNISTNNISTTFGYAVNLSTFLLGAITGNINTLTVNSMTGNTATINVINTCNISSFYVTASNISTNNISTNFAYLANLSTFLLGAPVGNITTISNTYYISASNISTQNLSTTSAYFSILTTGTNTGTALTTSTIASAFISTQFITASNISTNNISTNFAFMSNVSTILIGAVNARITTLNTGTTVFNTLNTGLATTLNNTLTVINVASTILNTLNVTGVTTLTSSLNIIGNVTLGGTLSTNTVSTNLITVCNISTWTISTNNSYSSNLSVNTLDVKSATFSNLSFYDGATASTATFRFSTLTGLVTPQIVNLLYFNNLVFAGANVWPGQTITALNWGMSCNGTSNTIALANPTFGYGGASNVMNYYIASNVTGGSGPYFIQDTNSPALNTYGLSIGTGSPSPFGVVVGQMINYATFINYTFNFTLRDSSYPVALVRYISLSLRFTSTDNIGNGGGSGTGTSV